MVAYSIYLRDIFLTTSIKTSTDDFLDLESLDGNLKGNLEELLTYGVSSGADLVEIFLEKVENTGIFCLFRRYAFD